MKPVYQKAFRLMFLLIVMNAVGAIGALFVTPSALEWYHQLKLATLTPPDIVFGIVWTILYTLMAISAFLTWQKTSPRWFCLFTAMTLLWPFVFFYLKSIVGGMIVIGLMLILYVPLIRGFWYVSRPAGILLIPVGLWTLFASYLNGSLLLG